MIKKKSKDIDVIASQITEKATDESKIVKNPAAIALGRLGVLNGGKARADKLSKERWSEIANKASLARWSR